MSAITGIFYRDGQHLNPEIIEKMNNTLSHRGPDRSNIWCKGSVALGHQMSYTTPESLQERLPFYDAESGMVITADARIDNRDELSEILGIKDTIDNSDSYYILKAYQKWGEKCPEKLLGDFAFVIWDNEKEILFCARDHIGVKPFYYYVSDNKFYFSTEIKALLFDSKIPEELNKKKLAFFLMVIDDKKSTFYKDISKLTAAHSITVYKNRIEFRKYWKLDPQSRIRMSSNEEYFNAFNEIFTESINCRLRSAFPLGFELSGGLDSSSVVCISKKIIKKGELNTFSYIFKDFKESNESEYIQKIIDMGGIKSHLIYADEISPLENVEDILWAMDEPYNYPSMSVIWNLLKKEHENNIRIILTGLDGDTVISKGQYYFRQLAVTMQWRKLYTEIRDSSNNFNKDKVIFDQSKSAYIKTSFNKGFFNILIKQVLFPLIPDSLKRTLNVYKKKDNVRRMPDIYLLNERFIEKSESIKYLNKYLKESKQAKSPKKYHYYLINKRPHQSILEIIDSMSGAFSIEQRHPFYDKRLIEFCYALPNEMKFQFGWDRYILRMSMEGILPHEIQWRFFKQD